MKKHTSRILCGLLLLALITLLLPGQAKAADLEGARQAIRNCYDTGAESVDLTGFQLTTEELNELFLDMCYGNELPWYANIYRCWAFDDGTVEKFQPVNLDEGTYDRNLYEQKVAEILQETVKPGMSDWQKMLSIHDYLVANCSYDLTYTYFEGYDLLIHGTAVCNGYAEAYMDLLKRVGIRCVMVVVSEPDLEHGWNLVELDGNWYHVDVTWDDPAPNLYGYVGHNNFLTSDETAIANGHHGWQSEQICSDKSYESGPFWVGVESRICYLDASTSFYRCATGEQDNAFTIYRRNEQTGDVTALYTQQTHYLDIGNQRRGYYSRGLNLWEGRLYFSDLEQVYSMDTDGSGLQTVYTYEAISNCLSGGLVQDGKLFLTLQDNAGNWLTGQELEVELGIGPTHVHVYVPSIVESTATAGGYTLYTCSCGLSYQGDATPALTETEPQVSRPVSTQTEKPDRQDEDDSGDGMVTIVLIGAAAGGLYGFVVSRKGKKK